MVEHEARLREIAWRRIVEGWQRGDTTALLALHASYFVEVG